MTLRIPCQSPSAATALVAFLNSEGQDALWMVHAPNDVVVVTTAPMLTTLEAMRAVGGF